MEAGSADMIESWELPNRSELIDYLRQHDVDRFEIFAMYLNNELPKFIESEDDAHGLADEVLGTTLDEDRGKANYSPDRPHFWGGVLAVMVALILLFN